MAKENSIDRGVIESAGAARSALLEAAPDPMLVLTSAGRIVRANGKAERLFGAARGGLQGEPAGGLFVGDEDPIGREIPTERTASERRIELTARARDGGEFPVELTLSPFELDRSLLCLVAIRDASSRKQLEQELTFMAEHDPLTGLFNRRRFEFELSREADRATRYGGGALALIDIDNFKRINDTYGHIAGDALIRAVARAIAGRIRHTDLVARLGGDEFAILLPSSGLTDAYVAGEELRCLISESEFPIDGQRLRATLSIGITALGDSAPIEEILARADRAMYQAKEAGRNHVAIYTESGSSPGEDDATGSLAWGERIRGALEADGFVAHFQPLLELSTGRIARWELLTRMAGPQGRLIPPAAFIGPAERFGSILEIDSWAVRYAVATIAAAGRSSRRAPQIEVNVSAISILDPSLPELIATQLAEHRIEPSCLIVELSEAAAMASIESSIAFADVLAELGCGFALDRFGAGFGSFTHLKHLPLTCLKIDGGLIRNLPRSAVDQMFVRSIIEIARGFGLHTVAEFVGDSETLRLLGEFGVDYGQGHRVGRPGPSLAIGAGGL